jgi:hypothetical protein
MGMSIWLEVLEGEVYCTAMVLARPFNING